MSAPLLPEPDARIRIIDFSAGNGAIWFDGPAARTVRVDIRHGFANCIADSGRLPFLDDAFDLGVFDPPHVNGSANGNISKSYGHHTAAEIRDILRRTSSEASRCICPRGLLAFKWNDHDTDLTRALGLMPEWLPLFGHHVAHRRAHPSATSWLLMANRK
ncbi:MAG: hypothetical protein KGL39_40845 [Patescibacteria group bacterium]|nr:hypothetical protein [Patescibacteria group bacterium]